MCVRARARGGGARNIRTMLQEEEAEEEEEEEEEEKILRQNDQHVS